MIIVMLSPHLPDKLQGQKNYQSKAICHEITIEERMYIWYQKKTAEKNGQ